MKLHFDKAAFQLVVDDISKKCSIRRDVLEKDYYVTLLLKELSEKEHQHMLISKAARHFIKR